jgi:hypothetical protein
MLINSRVKLLKKRLCKIHCSEGTNLDFLRHKVSRPCRKANRFFCVCPLQTDAPDQTDQSHLCTRICWKMKLKGMFPHPQTYPLKLHVSRSGKHLWNRRIWGSHAGEYEDGCLLGCSAVLSGRSLPTFQRSLLPPSSGRSPSSVESLLQ